MARPLTAVGLIVATAGKGEAAGISIFTSEGKSSGFLPRRKTLQIAVSAGGDGALSRRTDRFRVSPTWGSASVDPWRIQHAGTRQANADLLLQQKPAVTLPSIVLLH